jgi:hypothetical protein
MMGLFFAAIGSAQASFNYYPASIPWSSTINQCIGGQLCGGTANTINVIAPYGYINYVYVQAHDNIGDKAGANLEVYVDGVLVGRQDVKSAGSFLYFPVNMSGSTVTLRSLRADGHTDETYVMWMEISN